MYHEEQGCLFSYKNTNFSLYFGQQNRIFLATRSVLWPKICRKCDSTVPDFAWGLHDAPQTPSRLGSGHLCPFPTPLGASIVVPHDTKSCRRYWSPPLFKVKLRQSPILHHPVLWVALPPSVTSTHHFHHPSPLHSFTSGLKPSFSATPSHCSLPFLLPDWLHDSPDCLPIRLSISVFTYLVFLFSQWRNYNFWAPGKHSLRANSLDT